MSLKVSLLLADSCPVLHTPRSDAAPFPGQRDAGQALPVQNANLPIGLLDGEWQGAPEKKRAHDP